MDMKRTSDFLFERLRIIVDAKINTEAAAMSYISLMALVPGLILFAWVIAKLPQAIADIEQLRSLLIGLLVPESATAIIESLEYILSQAQSLPVITVLWLLLTIFSLMLKLERAFNSIFHAPRRKLVKRLIFTLIAICVGPLLLALMLAAGEIIQALQSVAWLPTFAYVTLLVLVTELIAATALFYYVPSVSSGLKLSLIGGALLVISLEVLRWILQTILLELGSYEVIYGVFAAIPLFFVWVYTFWVIVFVIAFLVYRLQPNNILTSQLQKE